MCVFQRNVPLPDHVLAQLLLQMDLDATTRKQCHAVLKDVVAEVEKAAKKEAWLSAWFARERFEVPLRFSHQELPSVDVDVNDLRQRIIKYCPRRMWLQWNGDAEGECYAPFLSVHFHIGVPFETFVGLLGSDLGRRMTWGVEGSVSIVFRVQTGLKRHSNFLEPSQWFYIDTSQAGPYLTPGILARCLFSPSFTCVDSPFFFVPVRTYFQLSKLKTPRGFWTKATFGCWILCSKRFAGTSTSPRALGGALTCPPKVGNTSCSTCNKISTGGGRRCRSWRRESANVALQPPPKRRRSS
jgi:hypothetical protein